MCGYSIPYLYMIGCWPPSSYRLRGRHRRRHILLFNALIHTDAVSLYVYTTAYMAVLQTSNGRRLSDKIKQFVIYLFFFHFIQIYFNLYNLFSFLFVLFNFSFLFLFGIIGCHSCPVPTYMCSNLESRVFSVCDNECVWLALQKKKKYVQNFNGDIIHRTLDIYI